MKKIALSLLSVLLLGSLASCSNSQNLNYDDFTIISRSFTVDKTKDKYLSATMSTSTRIISENDSTRWEILASLKKEIPANETKNNVEVAEEHLLNETKVKSIHEEASSYKVEEAYSKEKETYSIGYTASAEIKTKGKDEKECALGKAIDYKIIANAAGLIVSIDTLVSYAGELDASGNPSIALVYHTTTTYAWLTKKD